MDHKERAFLRNFAYNLIQRTLKNKPKLMKITSWKTTSAGILLIIGSIGGIFFAPLITLPVIMTAATGTLAGIGLLFSKDSNVTGGTTPATPEAAHRTNR